MENCTVHGAEGPLAAQLYALVFPVLLVVGVVGNVAASVLYLHPYLRSSPAIRMLLVKAAANIVFLLALLPNFIFYVWPDPLVMADFYFFSIPKVQFIANVCSSVAVWMTVGVGLEQLSLVLWPLSSRSFLQVQLFVVACLGSAVCLEMYPLIVHRVIGCDSSLGKGSWRLVFRTGKIFRIYHDACLWLHFFFVLLGPLLVLGFVSFGLWHRLFRKSRFRSFGGEKEVVVRLALVTAAAHLLLEMPGLLAMPFTTFIGIGRRNNVALGLVDAANFASLANAAVPFPLYVACSARFRWLCVAVFCPCAQPPERRASLRRPTPKASDGRRGTQQTLVQLPLTQPLLLSSHLKLDHV